MLRRTETLTYHFHAALSVHGGEGGRLGGHLAPVDPVRLQAEHLDFDLLLVRIVVLQSTGYA